MSFSSRRGKHSFSIRDASATSDIFDDDGWVVSSSSIRRKNASIIKVDAVEDDDFDDDVFFVVVVVSPFASFPSSTVVVVDLKVVLLLALVVLEVVLVMVVVVFFIVRDERETQLKCGTKDAPFLGGKEQDQKKLFRVSYFFSFFCEELPKHSLRKRTPDPLLGTYTSASFRWW